MRWPALSDTQQTLPLPTVRSQMRDPTHNHPHNSDRPTQRTTSIGQHRLQRMPIRPRRVRDRRIRSTIIITISNSNSSLATRRSSPTSNSKVTSLQQAGQVRSRSIETIVSPRRLPGTSRRILHIVRVSVSASATAVAAGAGAGAEIDIENIMAGLSLQRRSRPVSIHSSELEEEH